MKIFNLCCHIHSPNCFAVSHSVELNKTIFNFGFFRSKKINNSFELDRSVFMSMSYSCRKMFFSYDKLVFVGIFYSKKVRG